MVVLWSLVTGGSGFSVLRGGQLIWKLQLLLVFPAFVNNDKTSTLSQGLGRRFRGCGVVIVRQLQKHRTTASKPYV